MIGTIADQRLGAELAAIERRDLTS